jgi:hypothetical protein
MKKVYSHDDRFMVWQFKQRLDEKGIPCFIKNEFASGAMGELSPLDSLPEVWIGDDEWLPAVNKLVAELDALPEQKNWNCHACGEDNAGSFELCWQCGQEMQQHN